MDQTHIGYTYWQQPSVNSMPDVTETEIPDNAGMGVAIEGSTNAWPGSPAEAVLPSFDKFNQQSHYLVLFERGKNPFQVTLERSAMWILFAGPGIPQTIENDTYFPIHVNWETAPKGVTNGFVKISSGTNTVLVRVPLFNPPKPSRNSVKGFVEANGYVSMEAAHFTKNIAAHSARWKEIPNLGRTLSSMSIFPVTAPSVTPPQNSPCLEYKMFLFDSGNINVETILSPSLNFVSGRGLRFALSFDDQPPQIVTAVPAVYAVGDSGRDWAKTVSDAARIIKTPFVLENPGEHTLKVWMVDPGVVLQKIVVDCGGEKPSYLGPPESFHR